ncbi:G-protein coupled receptor family C group 5 member C isoform X2 [Oreochromis niloticus]|uniref:G-protein coupled receptor family C group 5 member C isoform X2 n=1 Tax=Oreochromis niloticus TaxID=8128 RepID=UPI000674D601|nr:G-protein coupled receptor family C group 5 member C isoform X2 [Oreochromis niloticus]
MSAPVLKACAVFYKLFVMSLSLQRVRLLWKTSSPVPVPKMPRLSGTQDCRPVALSSHVLKTLERLILKQLPPIVGPHQDLLQFTYQPHLGTEDTIIYLLNRVYAHLDEPEDPNKEQPDGEEVYPARSLVYDNILKEPQPTQQHVYIENKAFSMDEPESTNPASPYGAYNGQARSCLYQPTEIALIAKGLTRKDQDSVILRTIPAPLNMGSCSSGSCSVDSLTSSGLS